MDRRCGAGQYGHHQAVASLVSPVDYLSGIDLLVGGGAGPASPTPPPGAGR